MMLLPDPTMQDVALTDARAHLLSHGWGVLRGVAGPAEVQAQRDAARRLVGEPRGLIQLTTPRMSEAVFAVPDWLGRVAGALLACSNVQLLQDALLLKPPGTDRIELHRDATYTGFVDPDRVISVRLALTDQDAHSGGLHVIDGSHEDAWSHGSMDAFGASIPPAAELRRTHCPQLEAGDITFHLARTLHGSFENRSDHRVSTVIRHVFDADATLYLKRIPEAQREHFPLEGGQLDPRVFPLLTVRSR